MQDPETFDEFFLLLNNFLNGATAIRYVPNSVDCSGLTNIFLNDANATVVELRNNTDLDNLEKVRKVTSLVSN
jgi:hypothetical protein